MKTVIVTFSSRSGGNCSQIGNLIASMTKNSVLFEGKKRAVFQIIGTAAQLVNL